MSLSANLTAPSPEHLAQLDAARLAIKKIRRAVSVANFDGWTIAAFAAISIVCSLTSPPGILLGLGMTYIAWRELSSGAALRRLDTGALRRLAINQVVLSAMVTLYFGWSLYSTLAAPGEISGLIGSNSDSTSNLGGDVEQLAHTITIWVYVGLILGSILFQGLTAVYYSSRTKILEDYLATTPQWIIDYQRGGGTL